MKLRYDNISRKLDIYGEIRVLRKNKILGIQNTIRDIIATIIANPDGRCQTPVSGCII